MELPLPYSPPTGFFFALVVNWRVANPTNKGETYAQADWRSGRFVLLLVEPRGVEQPEDPLRPLNEAGVGGVDLARPIVIEADALQLFVIGGLLIYIWRVTNPPDPARFVSSVKFRG